MPPISRIGRLDEEGLREGLAALLRTEHRFAAVIAEQGIPKLRTQENSLQGLLHIVTQQVISLSAAAAIWSRLCARLDSFEAQQILNSTVDQLVSTGLTRAKARTFQAIAAAVKNGQLQFAQLDRFGDEEARAMLLDIHGVGPWTADIFLLTCLGRRDIFPAGDRALQLAAGHLINLPEPPQAKEFNRIAYSWRPNRTIAALLLWSHYRSPSFVKRA